MNAPTARALTIPGLLFALVLTSTMPAWAGAASARSVHPATACPVDSPDTSGESRC